MASSRVPAARLDNLWQHAREPVFLLSPEGKLVLVNRAWEDLTGYPGEQVVGVSARAHGPPVEPAVGSLAASFYPPREVFTGQAAGGPTLIVHASGERRWRRVEFWPFHDENGDLMVVFGIVRPPEAPTVVPDAESQRLRHDLLEVRRRLLERHGFDDLVGVGPRHDRLLGQVRAAAATRLPTLIVGEPGTGKRRVAGVIHALAAGVGAPLISVDCEALTADLLERELFASAEPANRSPAPFPDGATVLLVEALRLPRDLQVRLTMSAHARSLRLLGTSTVEPDEALWSELVQADYFYGMTTFVIRLPSLRERLAEIPFVAQTMLERANMRGARQRDGFAPEALAVLQGYDWPGNLAELERVVAHAHERAAGDLVEPGDLPAAIRGHLGAAYQPPPSPSVLTPLDDLLTQVERRLIEYALQRARQNKSKAADVLGISRPRLYRRIKELGLPDEPESLEETASSNGSKT